MSWDDDDDLEKTLLYGDPFGGPQSAAHTRAILSARSTARQHARDVLTLAIHAGMPDTYLQTDARIQRALDTLGLTLEEAEDLMESWLDHLVTKQIELTDWAG